MAKRQKKGVKTRIEKRSTSLRSRLVGQARTIIMGYLPAVAIFLGTRTLLAEAYRIPSGSMEPTLQVGDWLFVNKLRLGPHIPFTQASLPGYAGPRRNDVVVFVSPPQDLAIRISPADVTPTLVKRIAGIPGDTLFMRHGRLFVNGDARSVAEHGTGPSGRDGRPAATSLRVATPDRSSQVALRPA